MTELFDMLSSKDVRKIENYIRYYAAPDGDDGNMVAPMSPMRTILANWSWNKINLFHLLGDNIIISKHVRNEEDIDALRQNLSYAWHNSDSILNKAYHWLSYIDMDRESDMKEKYGSRWGDNHDEWSKFVPFTRFVSTDYLVTGRYDDNDITIDLPDSNKPYKISKGMRIMRIIARIHKAYGSHPKAEFTDDDYEELRLYCSMQRNQAVLEGELCLSIHPLDFITMSDNASKWSSCMHWTDGSGEYRQGTVEMMNSPVVVEAYLHHEDSTFSFGPQMNDEWNDKKWRQLFIINDKCLVPIKGYPYQSIFLRNEVIAWLKQLAHDNMGWDYPDEMDIEENYLTIAFPDNDRTISVNFIFGYMYCDLGTSYSGPTAYFNTEKFRHIESRYYDINVSGPSQCMWCGSNLEIDDCDNCSLVVCDSCYSPQRCAYCGRRLYEEGTWIEELDGYICENCYDEEVVIDALTGEYVMINSCVSIQLYLGTRESGEPEFAYDAIYIKEESDDHDWSSLFKVEPEMVKFSYTTAWGWENTFSRYCVTPEQCTDKALDCFGLTRECVERRREYLEVSSADLTPAN